MSARAVVPGLFNDHRLLGPVDFLFIDWLKSYSGNGQHLLMHLTLAVDVIKGIIPQYEPSKGFYVFCHKKISEKISGLREVLSNRSKPAPHRAYGLTRRRFRSCSR